MYRLFHTKQRNATYKKNTDEIYEIKIAFVYCISLKILLKNYEEIVEPIF